MPDPATDAPHVRVDVDGPVATITLDRPAQRNAMSAQLMQELIDAAARLDADPSVRAVVLRGSGPCFSAGADRGLLSASVVADPAARDRMVHLGSRMAAVVEDLRAVTIAALHGWCIGGGVVLAAACDLRVAASGTTMSLPEVDLGIPLTWGGVPRLVAELGPARTRELVLTCRTFTAEEAERWGFLTAVVPESTVVAEAEALARTIAAKPWLPVVTTTRQVRAISRSMVGMDRTWADGDLLALAMGDLANGTRSSGTRASGTRASGTRASGEA